MTATRPPRRRAGRSSAAAAETLQRLTAARADLDAAVVERRRREDALIEQYAAASGEIADVVARRDAALADLDRRTREIRDAAAAELAEIQARQQQVLVELNHHRTLEELSTWFGVPEKRLRQILRAHRASGDVAGAAGGSDRSDDVAEPRPPSPPGVAEVPVAEPAPAPTTSVAATAHRHRRHLLPHQLRFRVASIRPAPSRPPAPADRCGEEGTRSPLAHARLATRRPRASFVRPTRRRPPRGRRHTLHALAPVAGWNAGAESGARTSPMTDLAPLADAPTGPEERGYGRERLKPS